MGTLHNNSILYLSILTYFGFYLRFLHKQTCLYPMFIGFN